MPKYIPIKESEQLFFHELIEDLPVGVILLDQKGTILGFNKKQEENSRINREEVLGKLLNEVFPTLLEQGLNELYYDFVNHEKPFSVYLDRYVPQFYNISISLYIRGVVLTRGEKAKFALFVQFLEESNPFINQLLDASPNIVIATENKKTVVVFNKTAQHLFGYEKEEIMGKPLTNLFHPEERESIIESLNAVDDLKQFEVRCIRKDESVFPAEVTLAKIRDDNHYKIADLFIIHDITDKKVISENLYQAQKLAVLGRFASDVAHQLNNPLVGVVNLSELLLHQFEGDEEHKELLKYIYNAGNECRKIVNKMFFLSSKNIQSGEDNNRIYVNITTLLEEIMVYFKGLIVSQNINVKKCFQAEEVKIYADPFLIRQAFINIILNSIQSMPYRGELFIKSWLIKESSQVKIMIKDNGEGIKKEFLSKIFEPFFTTKDVNGIGLGLSITHRIIHEHNGLINISSAPKNGTEVLVTLPVKG